MRDSASPSLLHSCICSQEQLESAIFQKWAAIVREPHMYFHRKLWEWCYIIQALYERNMLVPGRRGLGFAVGREPLAALFAKSGCEILASDLDFEQAQHTGWADSHQYAHNLSTLNERGLCPSEQFEKLVRFRSIDMNHIPEDLHNFDFIWSACSLEHLGSIDKGIDFIINAMRCLRPGGYAIHTTEYNLSSNTNTVSEGETVIFRRMDIESIVERLHTMGHHIEVDFTEGTKTADRFIDLPPYHQQIHLRLQLLSYVSTSIGLIIQKVA